MPTPKVVSGAIIEITVDPKRTGQSPFTLGRALSLRIMEQYGVRPIYGIGALNAQELPVLQYSGTMSLNTYAIDSRVAENILNQFERPTPSGSEAFIRQLLYTEGVNVTVSRRAQDGSRNTFLKVSRAVCTGEDLSITQGDVVTRSGNFVFADPVAV